MINKEKYLNLYSTGITEEELLFEIGNDKETFGYTWEDITELLNIILCKNCGVDKYRKDYNNFKRFYEIYSSKLKNNIDKEYNNELDSKLIDFQKEKYKFMDQRIEYNAILRKRSRQEEINEIIKENIKNFDSEPISPLQYQLQFDDNFGMIIPLNDIHCGYSITSPWGDYNVDILKSRIEYYQECIKNIQITHKCKECFVTAGGDMISGNIHPEIKYSNNLNVIEQIITVSEYIAQFLYNISPLFERINFVSVSGNHSRIERKDDSMKNERLDDIIEWYLKAKLSNIENIIFDNYDNLDITMKVFNLCNNNYMLVHGDYDNDINKLLSLQNFAKKPITAVIRGHLHHNSMDSKDGISFLMSGSFSGVDSYTISKRIFSKPEQMITIVNNGGIVCMYNINLL